MTDAELSGPWNTARLNDLAHDVADIKRQLADVPRLRDLAKDVSDIKREMAEGPRLRDVAEDMADIKRQLERRHDEEKDDMRQEISELRQRPRQILIAFAAPIFVGLVLYLITHAI